MRRKEANTLNFRIWWTGAEDVGRPSCWQYFEAHKVLLENGRFIAFMHYVEPEAKITGNTAIMSETRTTVSEHFMPNINYINPEVQDGWGHWLPLNLTETVTP